MMNEPKEKQKPLNKLEKATFGQYMKMFSGVKLPWLLLILALLSQIGGYIAAIRVTYITGDVVDATGNIATSKVIAYAFFYAMLAVTSVGSYLFQGVASERVNLGLRQKLWRKLMYIPQKHYDKDSGETLVSRVTTDCDFASTLFTTILECLGLISGLVLYINQMLSTSKTMTAYMLILLPASAVMGWLFGKAKYWVGQRTQGTLSSSTAYLIERTQNLRLVKASTTENIEEKLGGEKFQNQYKIDIKTGYVGAFFTFIDKAISIFGIAIPFIFGGILVSKGVLTVGQVVAFYMFSGSISSTFSNFINFFGSIKLAVGSLARVINTFNIGSENVEEGSKVAVPDADISLKDVEFGYGNGAVLKDFNCIIPKNKTTAVIGANGSGKTTLFKLLERFYEPDKGYVYFGDTDVKRFSLHSWRKAFALVAQDRPLMEGTIRENITYGCERDITDAELQKVAEMSRVDNFVKNLPDGFDSHVAPGGQNFSGGQRQCMAIARAIMHNPDYLLLDEATSNLDAKSERMVTDALSNLMKNRTTVIIAHNLSAIRHADNVIVIKNGRVAACGSPKDIIKTSNDYKDFVMSQRRPECQAQTK